MVQCVCKNVIQYTIMLGLAEFTRWIINAL